MQGLIYSRLYIASFPVLCRFRLHEELHASHEKLGGGLGARLSPLCTRFQTCSLIELKSVSTMQKRICTLVHVTRSKIMVWFYGMVLAIVEYVSCDMYSQLCPNTKRYSTATIEFSKRACKFT